MRHTKSSRTDPMFSYFTEVVNLSMNQCWCSLFPHINSEHGKSYFLQLTNINALMIYTYAKEDRINHNVALLLLW